VHYKLGAANIVTVSRGKKRYHFGFSIANSSDHNTD